MKKDFLLKRKIFSSILSLILALSFILAPVSQTLRVNSVQAQAVTVVGGIGTIQETISAVANKASAVYNFITSSAGTITAAAQAKLVAKEFIFDNIAWMLVNMMLKEMIRSTTKWVNSGFKGSPAFVTNMEGFLTDIADKAAGNFIYGSGLQFLCSPFKLNIKLALDIQYRATRAGSPAQCRLSSAIRNIDRFLDGDFLQGGWNGWYSVTLNPQNNVYGAMLDAQAALSLSIGGSQKVELDLLSYGKGFLSKKECVIDVDGSTFCSITTPGETISNQLNQALGLPMNRLAVADELNELIGALMGQLASEALGGIGGLLGLTESRNGYAGNYFNRMAAEAVPQGNTNTTDNPFQTEITTETRYRDLNRSIVLLITDARIYKDRVWGNACTASGALTGSLSNQLRTAERDVASSTALIATLNAYRADYDVLSSSTAPSTTVRTLLTRYNASSIPEAQSRLMNQYLRYTTSGALHGFDVSARLELTTIPDLRTEIGAFTASIDIACTPPPTLNRSDDTGV